MKKQKAPYFFLIAVLAFLSILILPIQLFAQVEQVAKEIVKDLSPTSGVVVMVDKGDVFIDRGSNSDARVGDIFTVYVTEKVIRHPITKKILGKTTLPIAILEVTKVKPKFSICTVLSSQKPIKPGQEVTRFADIPTIFVDRSKASSVEVLHGYLKTRLGDLNWLPDVTESGQKLSSTELENNGIVLAIVAEADSVKMFDQKLRLLRLWPWHPFPQVPMAYQPVPGAPARRYPPTIQPGLAKPAARPEEAAKYPMETSQMEKAMAPRYRKVAEFPQSALSVDIYDLDADGTPEAIFITEGTLQVRGLSETGNSVGHSFRGFGRLVSVTGGEGGYIALNIYIQNKQMKSMILRYTEGQLRPIASDLNYILAFVDLNNDGKRETLLAQDFDSERFFGARVFKMRIEGRKVRPGPDVKVPRDFHLIGATFADLNGNGTNEIAFVNEHHKLMIFEGNKKLWVSPRRVGGGVQDVSLDVGTDYIQFPENIPVETPPLVVDLNRDGKKDLLITDNKSTVYHLVEGFPTYEYGRISLVTSGSLGYQLLPFSGKISGPVVGLGMENNEIYCGLIKGSLLWGKATSYILAFPLPQARAMQVLQQKSKL